MIPVLVLRDPDGSLYLIARPALEAFRVPAADRAAVEAALAEPEVVGYAQGDFVLPPALPSLAWGTVPAVCCRTAGGEPVAVKSIVIQGG
jgi:hypothetical protein